MEISVNTWELYPPSNWVVVILMMPVWVLFPPCSCRIQILYCKRSYGSSMFLSVQLCYISITHKFVVVYRDLLFISFKKRFIQLLQDHVHHQNTPPLLYLLLGGNFHQFYCQRKWMHCYFSLYRESCMYHLSGMNLIMVDDV